MAKYLVLIYGDEQQWAARTPEQVVRLIAGHEAFRAAAGTAVLYGNELAEASTSTTLRSDPAGALTTTDGPFLETKEALGGYYLIEAADLDRAIALCSLLPEVTEGHSGVEIRPVGTHN